MKMLDQMTEGFFKKFPAQFNIIVLNQIQFKLRGNPVFTYYLI